MNTFTSVILISLFACVEMWPRGAPNSTCDSMMPGHGKPRQAGPSPYTLTLSKTTYRPNENIQLTLSGSLPFKGFLIKPVTPTPTQSGIGLPGAIQSSAQVNTVGASVGSLATTPQAKNNCPMPSLTHTNNNTKQSLTFTWIAPGSDQGPIIFQYTVVQSKDIYWVGQETNPINYQPDRTDSPNNPNNPTTPNSQNPGNQNRPGNPGNSSYRARPSIIALVFSFLTRVFKGW